MTDHASQLAEVQSLKAFNASLLRKWMEAAAQCMNPATVTGKDFNRMGELLIAASKQLEDERSRLASELRRAEDRKKVDALMHRHSAAVATTTTSPTPKHKEDQP